jgi:hypothetical protein
MQIQLHFPDRKPTGNQPWSVLDLRDWRGQWGKLRICRFKGIFTQNCKVLKIILLPQISWPCKISRWAQGQPDNANGNENCLALELSGQGYAFKDENCNSTNRYICVAMDTSKSTTGGRQAQMECAAAFGIDEGRWKKWFHVIDTELNVLCPDALDSLMATLNSTGVVSVNFKVFQIAKYTAQKLILFCF